jgi:hypothetical protein
MRMKADIDEAMKPRILFTAPWDPPVVRRGDALGLRALADQFADVLAPGLSNRVRDGRWVTILAWCLARSQELFHARGGRSVQTRQEQSERYGWLRPLELMWIARTIALAGDWRDRSLAGRRRVRPWYEDDGRSTPRFGMSLEQFRAYRQTGMYGGYRLAFRKWPNMTVYGNGWTPGPATNRLAKWMDIKLGAARPAWPLHLGDDHAASPITQTPKLGLGDKHDWWLRHWTTFDVGGRHAEENTLPRLRADFAKLPEAHILEPLVFGDDRDGVRRRKVALEIQKAAAADHFEVCDRLGAAFRNDATIEVLPRFTRLADAGMMAMDLIATALGNKSSVALKDVAAHFNAAAVCSELRSAADAWRGAGAMQPRHIEQAHRFASAITNQHPLACLRAVLEHHEIHGGGLRWFVLRDGKVEARSRPRAGSSRYRFRLWSLCRLGAQCGVLRGMPAALRGDNEAEEEDETAEGGDD